MKHIILLCQAYLLSTSLQLYAQQIRLENGDLFPEQFCYNDTAFALTGDPAGGTFSGCGIFQQNGQWYFNPVMAAQNITVFPHSCVVTYTRAHIVINKRVIVHKPVIIDPPLSSQGTCDGSFLLKAATRYAGSYTYLWSPPGPVANADRPETRGHITQTTTFYLTATDNVSGCSGQDSVVITQHPVPVVSVTPGYVALKARESIQLAASGATSYQWIPGKWLSDNYIADPVAYPREPVVYTVTGRNEFGCFDTARVTIDIIEDFFIPSAFSPNGDGLNDIFKIENIGYQGTGAFRIYDRWGQLVFESLDATSGWDGTVKGQPAAAGTYYYIIILNDLYGNSTTYRNDLTLIR